MTEAAANSKKDVAAVYAADYPPPGRRSEAAYYPIRERNMRIFVARSGRTLLAIAIFGLLSLARCFGEGETAADGSSAAASSSSSSDSGSTSNVGLGTFSRLPFNISASVYGGYDDNPNTLPDGGPKQDSWFTTAAVIADLKLETPRTKLDLSSNFGFTYYSSLSNNELEPNINLTVSLTHKLSPRLTLGISSSSAYQTEPDFQYGLGTNRRAGNYFYTTNNFSASYAWVPRFSTVTSWGINYIKYDDIASGLFEDRAENTFGNQFRFLILPTTNLVGEYRYQIVSYLHEGDVIPGSNPPVRLERDSNTHFLLGGFDHAFTPRLSAVFRGGIELRDYESVGEKDSPYFESTVTYLLGKDTSVQWYTRYGVEEGDIQFNPTRTSFRTGLQGRHNLTARISASFSVYYDHDDYDQTTSQVVNPNPPPAPPIITVINPSFTEDAFYIDLALRYSITRYMGIQTGYDHTEVTSGTVGRDYSRNRVWGGFTVAF